MPETNNPMSAPTELNVMHTNVDKSLCTCAACTKTRSEMANVPMLCELAPVPEPAPAAPATVSFNDMVKASPQKYANYRRERYILAVLTGMGSFGVRADSNGLQLRAKEVVAFADAVMAEYERTKAIE